VRLVWLFHVVVSSVWTIQFPAGVHWACSQSSHCVFVKKNCMLTMSELQSLSLGSLRINYRVLVHVLPFWMRMLQLEHSQGFVSGNCFSICLANVACLLFQDWLLHNWLLTVINACCGLSVHRTDHNRYQWPTKGLQDLQKAWKQAIECSQSSIWLLSPPNLTLIS